VSGPIKGISRTSLWRSWKAVRRELRRASVRDVVDYLEWDLDPDKWINRLLRQISDGVYEPHTPKRFTEAKSGGFSRRMTLPEIPDLVLYRTIADYIYRRARRREVRNAYCERGQLPVQTRTKSAKRVPKSLRWLFDAAAEYETRSTKQFRAWLLYDQYRKRLIFDRVYPFIVVTDITNFFDSVLYSRITSALHGFSAPPQMIGLLFFLLERLSLREAYGESPRIGLPVDEFGCSRKIAHVVLFQHDQRMVAQFGDEAYVRWMDDQNIGVSSRADGLEAIGRIGDSLARLHLTANAKKSRVFTIAEARQHFHFTLNKRLDEAEDLPTATRREQQALARHLRETLARAKPVEGQGQWDKILKRVYRLAAFSKGRWLRRRALADLLKYPGLASRIADYIRVTGTVSEFVDFAESVWRNSEQVYGDVNATLFESCLRLEPSTEDRPRLRRIAVSALRGEFDYRGSPRWQPLGPLLVLRFGDRRSLPRLKSCFDRDLDRVSPEVSRAAAVVFAGHGPTEERALREAASRLHRNHLSELVRVLDRIHEYDSVPDRWHLIRIVITRRACGGRALCRRSGVVSW